MNIPFSLRSHGVFKKSEFFYSKKSELWERMKNRSNAEQVYFDFLKKKIKDGFGTQFRMLQKISYCGFSFFIA